MDRLPIKQTAMDAWMDATEKLLAAAKRVQAHWDLVAFLPEGPAEDVADRIPFEWQHELVEAAEALVAADVYWKKFL